MQELLTQSVETSNVAKVAPPYQAAEGPVFVIGMFRSGTSLLYALLNQHPEIALMYEGDLPHVHSLFWFGRNTKRWMAKWSYWNGALPRHNFDTSTIPDNIRDLKTAFKAVHVEYARQKKGASIWGCKSPTYYDELVRLNRTFPNARFIIIWRDVTSICRSLVAAQGDNIYFSRKGMLIRVLLGYHEMKRQSDELAAHGAKVHQLYYEDLVQNPARALEDICDFLEVPFDPRMTRLEDADRSAIQDGSHHSMVKSKKIVAKTKRPDVLSPELKRKIEGYIFMWRRRYQSTWPLYPATLPEGLSEPGLLERTRDTVVYRLTSTWSHLAPIAYSFVPLVVWKRYRSAVDAWRYSRLPKNHRAP